MPGEPTGPSAPFVYFVCQVGAEGALKAELSRARPDWRLAFSRPGFLTFKTPGEAADELPSLSAPVFARAYGASLGKVRGESIEAAAAEVRRLLASAAPDGAAFDRLHVWQRDTVPVGRHGFEPLPTPLAGQVVAILRSTPPGDGARGALGETANSALALAGQRVLDCVIVEPGEWWIGWHAAGDDPATCWVGGTPAIEVPAETISRAYLKMEESLRWSRFPLRAGDPWAEIGCAPGGASQALLHHGMTVLGIDPAEVDPRLAANPRFTHLRMRGADARRRAFRDVRWLAADVNVAPAYTLDMVEAIVTHASVDIEGVLLTLKLLDWNLADETPLYLERIRSWGYTDARARQLAFNRQELCVAALRPPRRRPARPGSAAGRQKPRRLQTRRKRLD